MNLMGLINQDLHSLGTLSSIHAICIDLYIENL